MTVVIADVEADALARTVEELRVEGVVTDVTDPGSVEHLAATVVERFGTCDLLCNNAGVGGHGTIAEQTLNDWNWVFDVNLRGVVHVLHTFLPILRANPRGAHMVNTASIAGLTAVVSGPYTATKYAVVGISETLRTELAGTSVGVSVLCPGLVNTRIARSERNRPSSLANADTTKRTRKWDLPMDTPPKVLDPSDVAAMVLHAVRHDEFWIVTDPSLLALSWPRYEELRVIAFGA